MMARVEDGRQDHSPRANGAAFLALLALLAACFAANDLIAAMTFPPSRAWQPLGVLVINLAMVGAVWGFSRLKPSAPRLGLLTVLLGVMAFAGFSVAVHVMQVLIDTQTLSGPWPWRATVMLVSNLMIGVGAIGTYLWLRPWTGWRDWKGAPEPVSPATRRANRLFGLKELLAAVAMAALIIGAFSKAQPFAVFSNSPIPVWIAIVAIGCWLLARGLREWWHHKADEHERRASDFGRRVGAGVFLAVTPVWWVAARAGLLPQPDVMILWLLTWMVTSIGWQWGRNH